MVTNLDEDWIYMQLKDFNKLKQHKIHSTTETHRLKYTGELQTAETNHKTQYIMRSEVL